MSTKSFQENCMQLNLITSEFVLATFQHNVHNKWIFDSKKNLKQRTHTLYREKSKNWKFHSFFCFFNGRPGKITCSLFEQTSFASFDCANLLAEESFTALLTKRNSLSLR